MPAFRTVAALAAALAIPLTACGTGGVAAPAPSAVASSDSAVPSVGESATSATDSTIGDDTTGESSGPAGTPVSTADPAPAAGSCLTGDSPEVQRAMGALSYRYGWQVDSVGSKPYPDCLGLQWVLLSTPGGTASSPYQVMFFHDNTFVSTANTFDTSYTSIVGESANSVQVQYRWLQGDEPSCCPQGGPVTITYTWDEAAGAVGQDPPLPEAMVDSYSR